MSLNMLVRCSVPLSLVFLVSACGGTEGGDCNYESTYDAIQSEIFDAKGCTNAACHGKDVDPAGGLDLREGVSLDNLVRIVGESGPYQLVYPGDEQRSLLYYKLAAKGGASDLQELGIDGDAMPFGASPGLTDNELEVLRAWIRGGAPGDSLVKGTEDLLGCSGPVDFDPNKIKPLDPPAEGEGVQFYSGAYDLPAESENEVCFVTYYNFTDRIPSSARTACPEEWGEGRECFSYGRNELAQDGQSHHSIISIFTAPSNPKGGDWGSWGCTGGDDHGSACDPTDMSACGTRGRCTTPVETTAACTDYSHAPDEFRSFGALAGTSATRVQLAGAQESTFVDDPVEGVYTVLPVEGFVSWNSHAFNLTTKDTTIEQWVNINFVHDDVRKWKRHQIFDVSRLFAMGQVAPFTNNEVCMTFTLPRYSRLMTLTSHMHQHGELFRIWSPPNTPCSGGSIATEDPNCSPPTDEPMYLNRLYEDPLYIYYDAENLPEFDDEGEADRTFKACAVFDNGAEDPAKVKRNSTAAYSAVCDGFAGIAGFATCGCEPEERACYGGSNQGTACNGDDGVCGGGMCDACPVQGGMTTNDEMFLPMGSYFVQPPE